MARVTNKQNTSRDRPLATVLQKRAFEPMGQHEWMDQLAKGVRPRIRGALTLVSIALDMKCFSARLHFVGSFNLGVPWVVMSSRAWHAPARGQTLRAKRFSTSVRAESLGARAICVWMRSNPKRGLVHKRRFAFTHLNGRDTSAPNIHLDGICIAKQGRNKITGQPKP